MSAFILSYDDGRVEDRRLVKILNLYGIKATFNLSFGLLGKENNISKDEVRELYVDHKVVSHILNHTFLARKSVEFIRKEIQEDALRLSELEYCVRGMAYPYGFNNKKIRNIAKECGIEYSRTTINTNKLDFPCDLLRW